MNKRQTYKVGNNFYSTALEDDNNDRCGGKSLQS